MRNFESVQSSGRQSANDKFQITARLGVASITDDIESLVTIGDCEGEQALHSVRSAMLEDFEDINKEDNLNILAQGGLNDLLSEGQQDTSLLMLEKEWIESQKQSDGDACCINNMVYIMDEEDNGCDQEDGDLPSLIKEKFTRT
jgi:hypothetical protein